MICAIIASRDGKRDLVVAAERVLDHVDQAPVAVGARLVGTVLPAAEDLDQVVVGDERPRGAHRVAVAALDRLADHRRRLEPAGADHRDVDRLLDGARVGQVLAFDLVGRSGGLVPAPARERSARAR